MEILLLLVAIALLLVIGKSLVDVVARMRQRRSQGNLSSEDRARVRSEFDSEYYLKQNPDVAASAFDPFEHFMVHGWRERRDPSPGFNVSYYLRRYPDIAEAGINPFVHYILHGRPERRSPCSYRQRPEPTNHPRKVSAIIPNYNHAAFLEQRIESVLGQTYSNVEILILDDCSVDESRAIIERYCSRHPDRIRAIFNERNSGNVFRQWRKGVDNSCGDLIWICESDDFCEADFLEKLVPVFKERSVTIGFGRIQFADHEGRARTGLDEYREGAEAGIWEQRLVRPAHQWFTKGFAVNNLIANVGGCVWRRQFLPVHVWDEAESFSVLGDWFLYFHLAGGGQIAYEPSAIAYFRQHGGNHSVTSFTEASYYVEHRRLMAQLRNSWGVPEKTIDLFISKVESQYRWLELEDKLGPLSQYLDRASLLSVRRNRPHILIAFLGFHIGGGEIFPINLANALRAQGHLVSMLALDMSHVKEEILSSLDPAIPVYDADWVAEIGADRFLTEAGISLVHSHMISLEIFFFEQCRIQTKVPYVVTLHGSYEAQTVSRSTLQNIAARVSHWVYTAEKNLVPFRDLDVPAGRFTKIGNAAPIDSRSFPKTRGELGIAPDAIVFTLVARGIKTKGWRAAVGAFKRLREEQPGRKMHLLLAGEGEEADRQALLHRNDPDITFLGYQARIAGLYRISDCAIVPTRFVGESFPFCVIEALQAGTPVVATRIGEIPSMIAPTGLPAGILIENQRDTDLFIEELKAAMAAMLDTSTRATFAANAARLGRNYRMEDVAGHYVALYERILRESSPEDVLRKFSMLLRQ